MPTLTFYQLGNADCCRIDLANGQKLLFDYADVRNAMDVNDKKADLAKALRDDLNAVRRDYFDVVAFTHIDTDHVKGSADFFWLEYAAKYQGEGRVKINEMWVPAAAITEIGVVGDSRVIRDEARHRLLAGKGIKVFSRPEAMHDWLAEHNLSVDDRRNCFVDAGTFVPGFVRTAGAGVEFFVHAPYAKRTEDGGLMDRNRDSLVFQATFQVDGFDTEVMLSADITYDEWDDIVGLTKYHNNEDRLRWNVFKLSHHCSYLSVGPEKGIDKTVPVDAVKWLFTEQPYERSIVVSSSKVIPAKGSVEDDDVQPPHRQAANFYRDDVLAPIGGKFIVTMENPTAFQPKPTVIEIGRTGAVLKVLGVAGVAAVTGASAPRAG